MLILVDVMSTSSVTKQHPARNLPKFRRTAQKKNGRAGRYTNQSGRRLKITTDREHIKNPSKTPRTPRNIQYTGVVQARARKRPVFNSTRKKNCGNAEIQQKKSAIFAWTTSQVKDSLRLYFDVSLAYFSVFIPFHRYLKMYDLLDPLKSTLMPNPGNARNGLTSLWDVSGL